MLASLLRFTVVTIYRASFSCRARWRWKTTSVRWKFAAAVRY